MTELENRIGYEFRDATLLEIALTTPSCRMERPEVEDNQRLEFLGDAVLGLLSADALFKAYPSEHEGRLTVRRTHLVSGAALSAAAERIGLASHLKRNSGAQPFPSHAKVLADAIEAIIGAAWLDGGLDAARKVFDSLRLPVDERPDERTSNPKGHLQMVAQSMKPSRHPQYVVDEVKGPDHAPIVTVTVTVPGLGKATATSITQRQAEIDAASALLREIDSGSKDQTTAFKYRKDS